MFRKSYLLIVLLMASLTACVVGPNYRRPPLIVPTHYKEAPPGWKYARPQDTVVLGQWWRAFHDPVLNDLEARLHFSNQSIAQAAAQYHQARALVAEARAAYFPTVTGSATLSRQHQGSTRSSTTASLASGATVTGPTATSTTGTSTNSTTEILVLDATWEPDIWGLVHRTVEASAAGAQASAANLAAMRLSTEASLAQFYFELRGVDQTQRLLNDTVRNYQTILQLTKNRYAAGTAALSDIIQARTLLETAQAQAISNTIARGQYEHAIAVLIGQPPANFSLKTQKTALRVPTIPAQIPSELLERRPDVAQAERLVAQANAQIGVAIAAFFPTLNLSATGSMLFQQGIMGGADGPITAWDIAAQLMQTIFDGGLRHAAAAAARANFQATVASYRQTVLAAFQDVEDNLIALQRLQQQLVVQKHAAADADLALRLVVNQYKAGTADYTAVLTAQVTAYTAEITANNTQYMVMTTAVGLMKAIGGCYAAGPIL